MAKVSRMRKKNRQLKITIDIPDQYENDEDFMNDLQDTLDAKCNDAWCILLLAEEDDYEGAGDPGSIEVTLHSIQMGDVLIGPEGEGEG